MSETDNRPTTKTLKWYRQRRPSDWLGLCWRLIGRAVAYRRERDAAREDRDVLAKQVDAMAATIESAQSEASRQSDRADKAESALDEERSRGRVMNAANDALQEALQDAMARADKAERDRDYECLRANNAAAMLDEVRTFAVDVAKQRDVAREQLAALRAALERQRTRSAMLAEAKAAKDDAIAELRSVCEHGGLRRSCDSCALAEAETRADKAEALAEDFRTLARAAGIRAGMAETRADKAEQERDELRSLWSCDEPARSAALEVWRAGTECRDGLPSVGAMLTWFRTQLASEREARWRAEQEAVKDVGEKAGPVEACRGLSGDGKETTRRGS